MESSYFLPFFCVSQQKLLFWKTFVGFGWEKNWFTKVAEYQDFCQLQLLLSSASPITRSLDHTMELMRVLLQNPQLCLLWAMFPMKPKSWWDKWSHSLASFHTLQQRVKRHFVTHFFWLSENELHIHYMVLWWDQLIAWTTKNVENFVFLVCPKHFF